MLPDQAYDLRPAEARGAPDAPIESPAAPAAARGASDAAGAAPVRPKGNALSSLRKRFTKNRDVLEQTSWVAFAALIAFCPLERWAFIFRTMPPKNAVWSDSAGYVDRAWRLANPQVVLNKMDAFYPPGTHALMAPLFWLTGSRDGGILACQWLWWVFAVVAVWAVGFIGLKLFRHPFPAALAMASLLMHWSFTAFTGLYMSETPFSCFMALSLLAGLHAQDVASSPRWKKITAYGVAGLLAGVTMTIRPQFGINAALIGVPLLLRRWPFVRIAPAAALAAMAALPVAGAIALNSHAVGRLSGLSNNAGFVFYQAHCDVVHVETRIGKDALGFAAPVRIQRMQKYGGNPDKKIIIYGHMVWDSGFFFSEGMKCIRGDGLGHVKRLWESIEDMFATTEPWPPNMLPQITTKNRIANEVYCYALILLIPAAIFLARRRRPERWLLLQLVTVLPVALLFVGDPRYRVPYDMFGCLIFGGLLAALVQARRDPPVQVLAAGPLARNAPVLARPADGSS